MALEIVPTQATSKGWAGCPAGSASGLWGEPGGEAGGGRGEAAGLAASASLGRAVPATPAPLAPQLQPQPPTAGERSVQKTGSSGSRTREELGPQSPPTPALPTGFDPQQTLLGTFCRTGTHRGKGGRAASPSSTHTTALGPSGAWEKPSIERRNKTSKDFALPAHSVPGSPLSRPEEPRPP